MDIYLRLSWRDERLATLAKTGRNQDEIVAPTVINDLEVLKDIWLPGFIQILMGGLPVEST